MQGSRRDGGSFVFRRGLLLLLGVLLVGGSIEALAPSPAALAGGGDGAAVSKEVSWLPLGPREAPRRPELFFFLGSKLSDPVEQLLDQAEAAVRRGEAHLAAGHLEHARSEFDWAVELLLTSPFDLQEDPRLRFGLDRLVDHIHRLELQALREATATEEPPEVPAPMEELADVPPLTFPLEPTRRAQLEQELSLLAHDLPISLNERVLNLVDYFHQRPKGRRIITNGLRRSGRYRELITSILEEEGLPHDLIYLAQAESAFQPHARSRARAVGLWQFLSWRAQEYGLEVDWWVDERRDPVKSTRAAARHLRDLYQQFQDWNLALAAYNSGPRRVEWALERAGGAADYWTLLDQRLLPRETRNFVPIILAIALVAKNPERYGLAVEPEPPLQFERVKVGKPTDLRPIAEVIGVDVDVLKELNPHLLRGVTPPDREDFELYVPVGTAEKLAAALPQLPESKRVYWQRHQVRRGDTLSGIAARYGSSTYAIAQANGISLRSTIYPGNVLVVPSGGSSVRYIAEEAVAERGGDGALVYRVRSGDTLSGIAGRHRVSTAALARANGFTLRSVIRPGDRLTIPEGGRAAPSPPRRDDGDLVYTVNRGDTLSSIADRYGSSASTIAQANGLSARSMIRPGDRLKIPAAGSHSAQRSSGGQAPAERGGQVHRVRWGDTLWDLARYYGVSVSELRRANPFLGSRPLRAGDRLVIPD